MREPFDSVDSANLANTTTKKAIKRDFIECPPTIGERITFNTHDDGIQAGFVSAFRTHLGNGEVFAWVELDHDLPGMFRAVPLRDIETLGEYWMLYIYTSSYKKRYQSEAA